MRWLISRIYYDIVRQSSGYIIASYYTTLSVNRLAISVMTKPLCSASMMLWSLHTENTRLIIRGIIFDVLRLRHILSRHLHVTDTFCQFCGIYRSSDLERLEYR